MLVSLLIEAVSPSEPEDNAVHCLHGDDAKPSTDVMDEVRSTLSGFACVIVFPFPRTHGAL